MARAVICKLCNKRRATRSCLAVNDLICAICCGEQRETTLLCPLDCPFLREARKHEKPIEIPMDAISDADIDVSEDFIRDHEQLLLFCIFSLLQASLQTQGAVDTDALEALAALIQTYRTAQSGLVYETRPNNRIAAEIQQKVRDSIKEFELERVKANPLSRSSDTNVFKMLVFLHRIGQQNLNGRSKGRMYIDLLRTSAPDAGVSEQASSIIL